MHFPGGPLPATHTGFGGPGYPVPFPTRLRIGGRGTGVTPSPHDRYDVICSDMMRYNVIYCVVLHWHYVKICENIWTFKICENMWKHVKTMSCVNMSSLDLLRTWLICRQYMEVFLFWKSEWAQRILWTFWKRTSALKMNKNTLKIRHLSTVVD